MKNKAMSIFTFLLPLFLLIASVCCAQLPVNNYSIEVTPIHNGYPFPVHMPMGVSVTFGSDADGSCSGPGVCQVKAGGPYWVQCAWNINHCRLFCGCNPDGPFSARDSAYGYNLVLAIDTVTLAKMLRGQNDSAAVAQSLNLNTFPYSEYNYSFTLTDPKILGSFSPRTSNTSLNFSTDYPPQSNAAYHMINPAKTNEYIYITFWSKPDLASQQFMKKKN